MSHLALSANYFDWVLHLFLMVAIAVRIANAVLSFVLAAMAVNPVGRNVHVIRIHLQQERYVRQTCSGGLQFFSQ